MEIGIKYKVKPTVDTNIFYDYALQILRPQNNEIGEPE